jgi:cell division initiation protein
MPYTPVELRHVQVARTFLGYRRAAVEQLLDEVADSFEDVWRERGELTDKVDAMETQLVELKGRESLLTDTLVSAEQTAAEVRAQAKRAAELIVAEAQQEARSVLRAAQAERSRLFAETRHIEVLLRGALGMLEERASDQPDEAFAEGDEPEQHADETWPRRDDTREFNLNAVPDPSMPPDQESQAG